MPHYSIEMFPLVKSVDRATVQESSPPPIRAHRQHVTLMRLSRPPRGFQCGLGRNSSRFRATFEPLPSDFADPHTLVSVTHLSRLHCGSYFSPARILCASIARIFSSHSQAYGTLPSLGRLCPSYCTFSPCSVRPALSLASLPLCVCAAIASFLWVTRG